MSLFSCCIGCCNGCACGKGCCNGCACGKGCCKGCACGKGGGGGGLLAEKLNELETSTEAPKPLLFVLVGYSYCQDFSMNI